MLEVTCPGSCEQQTNETICLTFTTCEWNNISIGCKPSSLEADAGTTYIGVVLSLVGNIIINAGMNSMRHAHVTNRDPATGEPIQEFWRIPWWWFGILGIVGGEVGNLIAYGYAPASIVTPIGAVGVLTNVLITTLILKERVRKLNFVGMAAVIGGIVVTVYFAPKADVHFSSNTFWADVIATQHGGIYFGVFAFLVVVMIPINKFFGKKSVVIAVFTSSVFGSLTILSAKTFSSLLTKAFAEGFDVYFLSPVPYLAFLLMLVTCVITMSYINTAMKHFGNCQVVPTYYALFTTLSVAASGFVFREFDCLTRVLDAVLFVGGIVLAMYGVSLVQLLPLSARCQIQPMQEEDMMEAKEEFQNTEDISSAITDGIKYSSLDQKPGLRIKPIEEAVPLAASAYNHNGADANGNPASQYTPPMGEKTGLVMPSAPEKRVRPSSAMTPDTSGKAVSPTRLPPLIEIPAPNAHVIQYPTPTALQTASLLLSQQQSQEEAHGERVVASSGAAAAAGPKPPPRRVTMLKPLPPRSLPLPNTATPSDVASGGDERLARR